MLSSKLVHILTRFRAPGKYVLKCLLSPDVRQLATTSADRTIKLWNLDGFTLDRTLVGTAPLLLQLACVLCYSKRNGIYVASCAVLRSPVHALLRTFHISSSIQDSGLGCAQYAATAKCREHSLSMCCSLCLLASGIACAHFKYACAASAQRLGHAGHQRWVWDCVFSVDAAYLVTASSDCSARLWDLSTGDAIRMYSGHHKAAVCCALNDSAIEGRDVE